MASIEGRAETGYPAVPKKRLLCITTDPAHQVRIPNSIFRRMGIGSEISLEYYLEPRISPYS